MRYDTILFDADMTLWDFKASEKCALEDVTRSLGVELTEAMAEHYHQVNDALWHQFDLKQVTREELTYRRYADYLAYLGVEGDPLEVNLRYERALGEYSIMLPGAEEMCRTLARHCTLYIITNGLHTAQTGRFDKSPIKPYIREMFISQDMGCQKPEREYFDKVFQAIGPVDRSRTVIVGDSLTSDIRGGLNAGLDTIWYNPEHAPADPAIPATYTVDSMDEIIRIILSD